MQYKEICRILSFYLWLLMIPLSIPFGIAYYCERIVGPEIYPQLPCTTPLLLTLIFTLLLGGMFWLVGRNSSRRIYRREALLLVLLVYLITPSISALPFFLSNTLTNPVDAFFEAVSGLTTTGASAMEAKRYDPSTEKEIPIEREIALGSEKQYPYYGTIERIFDPKTGSYLEGLTAVNPALLFWRSFMQWLGGMGIIVLFVAILPALGVGGKLIAQAEISATKESLFPRIKETASQLWKIYCALTILQIVLLLITNHEMTVFDALTISLATMATGGYTPIEGGIASFHSAATDFIIIIFMILGSISFPLYFYLIHGKFNRLRDPEFKTFFIIIFIAVGFVTWQLVGTPKDPLTAEGNSSGAFSFFEALRYGAFQVISAQTTTGFYTSNFDLWPFTTQVLMLILMFVGGMSGSTTGGIKIIRLQTFFKIMMNKIESVYRPDTVRTTRVGSSLIDTQTGLTVLCFIMISVSLAVIGTFLLVWDGIDPETSLTTISSVMNTVGFAFRLAGPTETFAFLPDFGKIITSIWMIAGRLEFFAVLVLFVPAFWKTTY